LQEARFAMRGLSLRVKVFFLFAGASLLIVVPTLLLIAGAVEQRVYRRANEELMEAGTSLQTRWGSGDETVENAARARALSGRAAAAWADGDLHGAVSLLREDGRKDILLMVDTLGHTIVGPRFAPDVLEAAGREGAIVAVPEGGTEPVRFALSPVWQDSVQLGYAGAGTRLSAAGVKKEYFTRGTEVALVVGDRVLGHTLPDTLDGAGADLEARLARADVRGGRQIHRIGGQAYISAPYAVPTRGTETTAILLRPLTDELRIADGIARSIFAIGFAALVLALVLAAVVARIVARPTQLLAEASARMARGDFDAPLPRNSGDEIGQLAGAFGEMRRAISEREARLRSAQAEMIHREKLAAMGRLVAQLSHEINNPIYNIQNCLEALERRGDPNDPNREFRELAQEELSRMAALTRRLLDQSRPHQGEESAPINLNVVLGRVLTLAAPDLKARGVEVDAELAPELPHAVAHPEAVQQVLANLVANACDAMPGGGRLRVSTRATDGAVEAVVEDSGSGISPDDLPHIFEAFYTTKPGVNGIGLGLFVSEGIMRGHRGRIDVESTPGKGSRFTVRLPRETLDEAMTSPPPERAAPRTPPVAAASGTGA
jgi:signal transduction histidine kinase